MMTPNFDNLIHKLVSGKFLIIPQINYLVEERFAMDKSGLYTLVFLSFCLICYRPFQKRRPWQFATPNLLIIYAVYAEIKIILKLPSWTVKCE